MLKQLWDQEAGFIVSAELVLVATLLVIGLIVGFAEVQTAVVGELNDVGEAVGRLNQSYYYSGFTAFKNTWGRRWGFGGGLKSYTAGSAFSDRIDECDFNECALACALPMGESPRAVGWRGGHYRDGVRGSGNWHDVPHRSGTCAGK